MEKGVCCRCEGTIFEIDSPIPLATDQGPLHPPPATTDIQYLFCNSWEKFTQKKNNRYLACQQPPPHSPPATDSYRQNFGYCLCVFKV